VQLRRTETRFWWSMLGMIPTLFLVDCMAKSGTEETFQRCRLEMVVEQIAGRGVKDSRVLGAMGKVPRHLFVPKDMEHLAYDDRPLPIGNGQTISQPYIVALMTELARLGAEDTVLEIGTGSGYQAAVLSLLAKKVYTIEYLEPLALAAGQRLKALNYSNVEVKIGDGYSGWPEHQPFNAILVTAAIDHVPKALLEQLKPGGRLVIPVGEEYEVQMLRLLEKNQQGKVSQQDVIPVRFVPFLGKGVHSH
jgi:protein-L-isoaspartate(D-aspartate) O-methyltransferase